MWECSATNTNKKINQLWEDGSKKFKSEKKLDTLVLSTLAIVHWHGSNTFPELPYREASLACKLSFSRCIILTNLESKQSKLRNCEREFKHLIPWRDPTVVYWLCFLLLRISIHSLNCNLCTNVLPHQCVEFSQKCVLLRSLLLHKNLEESKYQSVCGRNRSTILRPYIMSPVWDASKRDNDESFSNIILHPS